MNLLKKIDLFNLKGKSFSTVFYLIFFGFGSCLYIIGGIFNIIINLHPITYFLPFFGAFISVFTYFYCYKRGQTYPAIVVAALFNNFIFSPFLWLTNLGFKGGFQYFVFLFLVYSVILLKGKLRTIVISLYTLTIAGLMFLEASYPELIRRWSAVEENYPDLIFSFLLSMIAVTVSVFSLVKLYEREHAKITELSTKDPLTKQYNRRFITEYLQLLYSETHHEHLSGKYAVFIDFDDFKIINDTKGHEAGDRLLNQVCQVITNNIRSDDYLSRIGGDEFLLIINTKDQKSSVDIVNRLLKKIEENCRITVSAGVTPLKNKKDADELFRKADEIMYQAKREGKNKCCFS
ncbi:MAG TPA: GGDEF domain-containing protein [Bacteroidales bacterium]|nr:GGDEF domain-containing protein [Bacteroidales bacterium]HRW35374.1 GGDEF domain-containing protein [Thermotogota bacterium]